MVLVLGIVKASLKILGIGIGVKKVVLLMSGVQLGPPARDEVKVFKMVGILILMYNNMPLTDENKSVGTKLLEKQI